MKYILAIFFSAYLLLNPCLAQDVTYSFANAQLTNSGGADFYEADIMVTTSSDFKLGSGQLYFDYNPQAFGNSAAVNGKVTITTSGYILGITVGFPFYNNFITNDNTVTRISFAWQQALSASCLAGDNVMAAPAALFHIAIEYVTGGTAFPANICFTSSAPFDDQTFTACGPASGSCTFADCIGAPGLQITNDIFDCSAAPLPLELLSFEASKQEEAEVLLKWETVNEINSSHFEVERSGNGKDWQTLGQLPAAGYSSNVLGYEFVDKKVRNKTSFASTYYYRLKMVDFGYSFEYSEVRAVDFKGGRAIGISPNPTNWGVAIKVDDVAGEPRNWSVKVYGLDGRLVLTKPMEGTEMTLSFPLDLQAGIYQVLVMDEKGRKVFGERLVFAH